MVESIQNSIKELYHFYRNKIAIYVIARLQIVDSDGFILSDEDSTHNNYWKEICLEIQDENSSFSDVHDNKIREIILSEIQKLEPVIYKFLDEYSKYNKDTLTMDSKVSFSEDVYITVITRAIIYKN